MIIKLGYRLRQFTLAWWANPDPLDVAKACKLLGPSLCSLFLQLQPGEQVHSLDVYRKIVRQGYTDPDLLIAALLHDVGKSCSPLSVWDRTWIVLARAIFPKKVKCWGQGVPSGWRRIFVVAEQHPAWGAEMAAGAGASQNIVALIRQHQDRSVSSFFSLAKQLHILQEADDES